VSFQRMGTTRRAGEGNRYRKKEVRTLLKPPLINGESGPLDCSPPSGGRRSDTDSSEKRVETGKCLKTVSGKGRRGRGNFILSS